MNRESSVPKFWMVWRLNGSAPTYQHHSKASAQAEAKRLASAVPNSVFVVLAAVDGYVAPILDPQPVKIGKPDRLADEIPF